MAPRSIRPRLEAVFEALRRPTTSVRQLTGHIRGVREVLGPGHPSHQTTLTLERVIEAQGEDAVADPSIREGAEIFLRQAGVLPEREQDLQTFAEGLERVVQSSPEHLWSRGAGRFAATAFAGAGVAASPIPGYILEEAIGTGATSVYRAVQEGSGRAVAIKDYRWTIPLSSGMAPSPEAYRARLRFSGGALNEVRFQWRPSSPHIVELVDIVSTPERLALVYELMERSVGAMVMQHQRPFTLRQAAQMIECVACLHEHGILHRDIKPENFLQSPGDGIVKMTDFQTSCRFGERPTTLDAAFYYLPPEARPTSHYYDPTADVYALGKTLFQMSEGGWATPLEERVALARQTPEGLMNLPLLLHPDPARPWHRDPPPFETILRRAMAPDPLKRYPDAVAMREDFHRQLGTHH